MKQFGYIWQGPRTASARRQRNMLEAVGVAPEDVFVDTGDSRSERDWLLQDDPQTLRSGDVVVIACEAYIAQPGRDRRRVLRQLAAKGVLVQVLDGEPVLYDSEDKIAEFLERARQVSQSDNGRAAAARIGDRRTGRPPKALTADSLTDDQTRALLRLWHDLNVNWRQVADLLADYSEAAGMPRPELTQVDLHDRLGKRKP